ncbi:MULTISPECIES: acyl-CoA dehydrogenase [unclassified Burkholderia]|uniref:acyl-CoA dehydrogenase n=1 Tax=unclassified Burkholderia TaxID=2613784 RepID=UPI00075228F1|nr:MULTISPECIES: acyl-CoA dehydrogenase [unclassified Burkholderia]KVN17886.1 acyl-CoA dehydrogenase [Burkholderia sp. MSMB1552]KWZ55562.1 acyl-CoA dehydrogenase [Burkholderia sp. MSMB1588]
MRATPAERRDDAVQIVTDLVSPAPAAALAATLDRDAHPRAGDPLPPLWHWLYFWTAARQSSLGSDGHPRTGGFLPDPGLPRRMAAGGRVRFIAPLAIGSSATRTSRVASLERKAGRSGRLAFVTVEHRIESSGALAIHEEQDIVYREPAEPGAPSPPRQAAPDGAHWQREIAPAETLLFRYSALTFNGHRIHYDRAYAQHAEGYPDLVVHGPLIATLLLDLVSRSMPDAVVTDYAYKAVRPAFVGRALTLCGRLVPDGRSAELWAKDHEGSLTMSARASLVR